MPGQVICDGGGKSLDLELRRNRVAVAVQQSLIALVLGVFAFADGGRASRIARTSMTFQGSAKTVASYPTSNPGPTRYIESLRVRTGLQGRRLISESMQTKVAGARDCTLSQLVTERACL